MAQDKGSLKIFNGKIGGKTRVTVFRDGSPVSRFKGAVPLTLPDPRPTSLEGKLPFEAGASTWFTTIAVGPPQVLAATRGRRSGSRGSSGGSRFVTLKVFDGAGRLADKIQAGWAAVTKMDCQTQEVLEWEVYTGTLSDKNKADFLAATEVSLDKSRKKKT